MGRWTEYDKHESVIWVKDRGFDICFTPEDRGFEGISKLAHYEDLEEQGRLTEQKHGRWIEHEGPYFKCSVCGISEVSQGLYCRKCGAKLKELE